MEIRIDKIDVYRDGFKVKTGVCLKGQDEFVNETYFIEFRDTRSYDIVRVIAKHITKKRGKENQKCPGEKIRKELNLSEDDFEYHVYEKLCYSPSRATHSANKTPQDCY